MRQTSSFNDQAWLSLSEYPTILIAVIGPFMDSFFLQRIGKFKTYIILPGLAIALILLAMSPFIEDLIKNQSAMGLSPIWFSVCFFRFMIKAAIYTWSLNIVPQTQAKNVTIMISLGFFFGQALSYNIFLPMNSKDWLNQYIFQVKHLNKELMTHRDLYMFISLSLALLAVYVALCVNNTNQISSQNSQEVEIRRPPFLRTLKQIPVIFKQKNFLVFIFFNSLLIVMEKPIQHSLPLKMVEHGVPIEDLAVISSITLPFYIITCLLASRFIKRGRLMRNLLKIKILNLLLNLHLYYILTVLRRDHYSNYIFFNLLLNSFVASVSQCDFFFWFTYLNYLADPSFGSVYFGIGGSMLGIMGTFPTTVGFQVIEELKVYGEDGYTGFFGVCFLTQVLILLSTYQLGWYLDRVELRE